MFASIFILSLFYPGYSHADNYMSELGTAI